MLPSSYSSEKSPKKNSFFSRKFERFRDIMTRINKSKAKLETSSTTKCPDDEAHIQNFDTKEKQIIALHEILSSYFSTNHKPSTLSEKCKQSLQKSVEEGSINFLVDQDSKDRQSCSRNQDKQLVSVKSASKDYSSKCTTSNLLITSSQEGLLPTYSSTGNIDYPGLAYLDTKLQSVSVRHTQQRSPSRQKILRMKTGSMPPMFVLNPVYFGEHQWARTAGMINSAEFTPKPTVHRSYRVLPKKEQSPLLSGANHPQRVRSKSMDKTTGSYLKFTPSQKYSTDAYMDDVGLCLSDSSGHSETIRLASETVRMGSETGGLSSIGGEKVKSCRKNPISIMAFNNSTGGQDDLEEKPEPSKATSTTTASSNKIVMHGNKCNDGCENCIRAYNHGNGTVILIPHMDAQTFADSLHALQVPTKFRGMRRNKKSKFCQVMTPKILAHQLMTESLNHNNTHSAVKDHMRSRFGTNNNSNNHAAAKKTLNEVWLMNQKSLFTVTELKLAKTMMKNESYFLQVPLQSVVPQTRTSQTARSLLIETKNPILAYNNINSLPAGSDKVLHHYIPAQVCYVGPMFQSPLAGPLISPELNQSLPQMSHHIGHHFINVCYKCVSKGRDRIEVRPATLCKSCGGKQDELLRKMLSIYRNAKRHKKPVRKHQTNQSASVSSRVLVVTSPTEEQQPQQQQPAGKTTKMGCFCLKNK